MSDYEKKYKEALNTAKDCLKDGTITNTAISYIETIFPELKEPEDEKIRKELIGFLRNIPNSNYTCEEMALWLDKQGERKYAPAWMTTFLDELRSKKHYFEWDEHKDIEGKILAIIKWMNPNYFNGKDDGRKPADKVEPKFKDGDVLNSPSHHLIWIYKDNEHFYACVNMNYVTENVATDGLISIPKDACPATKEQRDLLFQKMHEVGYEWDADKKELKKIEVEPAWSEEDKVILDEIIDFFENGTVKLQHDLSLYASWLKFLKDRVKTQQE